MIELTRRGILPPYGPMLKTKAGEARKESQRFGWIFRTCKNRRAVPF